MKMSQTIDPKQFIYGFTPLDESEMCVDYGDNWTVITFGEVRFTRPFGKSHCVGDTAWLQLDSMTSSYVAFDGPECKVEFPRVAELINCFISSVSNTNSTSVISLALSSHSRNNRASDLYLD